MTAEARKKATIIGVVAGVEIAFGVIEGIVMPNIFERKKGDPFFVPGKMDIAKIGGTLLITGIISGVIADWVLEKFKITDQNRAKAIAGVAIGLNVVETVITFNVNKKWDKNFKPSLPKMHEFAPAFAFLVVTSLIGGYASDSVIAALSPSEGGDGGTQIASTPGSVTGSGSTTAGAGNVLTAMVTSSNVGH